MLTDKTISPKMTVFNATLKRADLNPREDHIKARIPGSILFNFDVLAD